MGENGLTSFAMHSNDADQGVAAISDELASAGHARSLDFEPSKQDPNTMARRYLNQMIASPSVPTLTAAEPGEGGPEYRTVGTETVPLTGTTVVKFAQYYYKIPVHGSLITIELDDDNSLLALNSALGDPTGVDPAASISPARALEVIREDAGNGTSLLEEPPRLYYYFDNRVEPHRWRLVYMAKNVSKGRTDDEASAAYVTLGVPELVDYVVDAHTGELLATLPRTQMVTWMPDEQTEDDAQGKPRRIRMQHDGTGNRQLSDTVRNVRTHDFNYQDVGLRRRRLPGELAANPPTPWSGAAISAHANAAEVAEFLLAVLQRDGLDNMGGPFISSINCTLDSEPGSKEWRNAAWIGTQMIYGQREVNGELQSYAVAKDVVAHEIIHGLTDNTARLVYERESGALNESYSDIFGVIISNMDQPDDVGRWNWEMGEDLDVTGVPLRDLSDPTKRGHPAHMDNFKRLRPNEVPDSRRNDSGWVHHNSGIHNKAAYNLMTSKKADGSLRFTPPEAAALFYLALTQFLAPTSGFSASRRGVELAAQTLFRHDPPETRNEKLAAIAKAFDDVGIDAV